MRRRTGGVGRGWGGGGGTGLGQGQDVVRETHVPAKPMPSLMAPVPAPAPLPPGEGAPAARAAEGEANSRVRGVGGASGVCRVTGVCGTAECALPPPPGAVCGRGPGLDATALQLLAARPRDAPGEGGGTGQSSFLYSKARGDLACL